MSKVPVLTPTAGIINRQAAYILSYCFRKIPDTKKHLAATEALAKAEPARIVPAADEAYLSLLFEIATHFKSDEPATIKSINSVPVGLVIGILATTFAQKMNIGNIEQVAKLGEESYKPAKKKELKQIALKWVAHVSSDLSGSLR